jgi:glycosyltransferase involved in cell wall biosynthesis
VRSKKSVLFVRPDYHCSFLYRDELRKSGWKADVYVPPNYPEKLLYSEKNILRAPQIKTKKRMGTLFNRAMMILWWLATFWRYHFHIYYGRPPAFPSIGFKLGLQKLLTENFQWELWLAKLFRVKLIYLPTGCLEDENKENFTKLDDGNVCNNCGFWDRCSDVSNNLNFSRVRRYFDFNIGTGSIDSSQFRATHMKYKSIDLNLWSPNLLIPKEHRLPPTEKLRILHSTYLENSGRNWKGRNIKGSPFVLEAIERLQSEGHSIEYFFIKDKPSNQMRFYQAQADIVVEQLIYGWWGSTFVETASLGKPVICYLRPSWKEFFLKTFTEYKTLPVIEADTKTVYDSLKKLIIDHDFRRLTGIESRKFAEQHFSVQNNTISLIRHLESL